MKCRKGPATGTTKSGAYWHAIEPLKIRHWGGDGIGNSGATLDAHLELRHYRSGEVRALVCVSSWHQNHGNGCTWHRVPILDCATVEDVIVVLKKGVASDYGTETVYSDYYADQLGEMLRTIGLPDAAPSPDEVTA